MRARTKERVGGGDFFHLFPCPHTLQRRQRPARINASHKDEAASLFHPSFCSITDIERQSLFIWPQTATSHLFSVTTIAASPDTHVASTNSHTLSLISSSQVVEAKPCVL